MEKEDAFQNQRIHSAIILTEIARKRSHSNSHLYNEVKRDLTSKFLLEQLCKMRALILLLIDIKTSDNV